MAPSSTPAVLVEDAKALKIVVRRLWGQDLTQSCLQPYDLMGPIHIVSSGQQLLDWLDEQPLESIRLLLLDYQVNGGTIDAVVPQLRTEDGRQHQALHPEVVIIGWSVHDEAPERFRQLKVVDGFISKHRLVSELIVDITTIIEHSRKHIDWIQL